jgi:N-acetyl-gamma-glutamyl-phosphate/LysW-gamma-L-alpha-aminoadipyl-6-phosphate reductase
MNKITVSIVGASGYTGGELLRLLLFHPDVEISQVTSQRNAGRSITRLHPNLRGICKQKFVGMEELEPCDLLFLCLPHGQALQKIDFFRNIAPRIIDLSADFRLQNPQDYNDWYHTQHPYPELLSQFVYGIPELHREAIREARYVSSAGCNATAVILGLYPLYREDMPDRSRTVVEVKAGSSQGGAEANAASHHPERSGAIRVYKPWGHRHIAEMKQELGFGGNMDIHFTATSIDMVRGIHCVAHTFLKEDTDEKTIWKLYRQYYKDDPFIRIINERDGIHRLPEPKILAGSNYCDIGFSKDPDSNRLTVFTALDNLVKGAAGQAVQAFNIMHGLEETTALTFPGLHPV